MTQRQHDPTIEHELNNLPDSERDELFARLRARQLAAITRLTPLNAMANVLNSLITMLFVWRTDVAGWMAAWCVLILTATGFAMRNWYLVVQRKTPRDKASNRAIRAASRHAIALAILWSVPPLVIYASGTEGQRLYITAVTAGMMCAGSFALYTIPRAALGFLFVVGGAAILSLAMLPDLTLTIAMSLLLLIFMLILTLNVLHSANVFRAQVIGEMLSEQQKQVISLLLNDFEQNTADVLLDIDEHLRLFRVSDKLNAIFGSSHRDLSGENILALIRLSQSGLPDYLRPQASETYHQLQHALKHPTPFKALEMPLFIENRITWWSITANPTSNGGWRGVIADITEKQLANHRIWQLAHRDSLTELDNRHSFQIELDKTLGQQSGSSEDSTTGPDLHALLILDLDRFKPVNDTFGHDSGDELLRVVARRLQSQTRASDIVARIGGDEFAILLKYLDDHSQAETIARRMVDSLCQPVELSQASVTIGASIGLAFIPDNGTQADVIMKHADQALYQAKEKGRAQVSRFTDDMEARAQTRYQLEQALRRALNHGNLSLAFQPQRHLKSGHILCLEVLARWDDPEIGSIPPDMFIQIAEETGMIHVLGHQVLNAALAQLSLWPSGTVLAVNISSIEMMNPGLVSRIAEALTLFSIQPHQLELEITETSLLDDRHDVVQTLNQLNDLGIGIALDDFGTGYSSLSYLRKFPFNKLKIDKSFVRELTSSTSAQAVVQSIIDMAGALKMKVVAEGVEDKETMDLLHQMGCDMAQGFYLFEPLSAVQCSSILVHLPSEQETARTSEPAHPLS